MLFGNNIKVKLRLSTCKILAFYFVVSSICTNFA